MFTYKITFGDGASVQIKANSYQEANEIASKRGIVSCIQKMR